MAYLGERKIANFRVRGAKKPHKNSENFKKRPGMSEEHLALIRQLPCCVCRKPAPNDPHHLRSGTGEAGGGLRSTDKHTVPVCRADHDDAHGAGSRNEQAWFLARGIDPHLLAADLWGVTGDNEQMKRVLAAHWENKP